MKKLKIENVGVNKKCVGISDQDVEDILRAMKKLKVKQSFLVDEVPSIVRQAAGLIGRTWLGKRYSIKRHGKGYRIGCVGSAR